MHVEIQVALNFFISFLYNKLPRRRVNQFGEELDRALKIKFEGHWYPEKPFKGSGYRCLKTTIPLDPVFDYAAQESGMDLTDIQNNLPQDLSIWIDPGEVSYRMGEKGVVKILYSESLEERELSRAFNPEAQCFEPIESVNSQLSNLSLGSPTGGSPYGNSPSPTHPFMAKAPAFLPKSSAQQPTFTIATFAQTKFGSTKLKSSSKRSHRMSPTEFNFLKQRALLQQQQQQQQQSMLAAMNASNNLRSLSPQVDLLFSPNNNNNNNNNNNTTQEFGGSGGSPTGSPPQRRQDLNMNIYQHLLVAN